MLTRTQIEDKIAEALQYPRDFAYMGELPLFDTHGLFFALTRDGEALEQSNWATISSDLLSRFPDDCEIVHSGHWMCGWIDQLAVRVIDADREPTAAFLAVLEWERKLDAYPVADEGDFSERETVELEDYVKSELEDLERQTDSKFPSDTLGKVLSWLYVSGDVCSYHDMTEGMIEDALTELGLLEEAGVCGGTGDHSGQLISACDECDSRLDLN